MDTSSLMTSNGTKTGIVTCWLDNNLTRQAYLDFFSYMSNEGWSKYEDNKFLQKTVNKFAEKFKKLCKDNCIEANTNAENYNKCLYTQDELDRLEDKYKGNVLEIIAESYFKNVTTQKYAMKYKCWSGQSDTDLGIDGYAVDLTNEQFLYAIQVKYRTEAEIGWQDGIQKAYVLVTEEMKDKWLNKAISDEEFLLWNKLHRVVLFTTTNVKYNMKDWSKDWLLVIDGNELYKSIGMYTLTGNKLFWENLYKEVSNV